MDKNSWIYSRIQHNTVWFAATLFSMQLTWVREVNGGRLGQIMLYLAARPCKKFMILKKYSLILHTIDSTVSRICPIAP